MAVDASRHYFKNASPKETWADPSNWPLASRTCDFIMREMKPKGKVCLSTGCGWGRFLRSYFKNEAKMVIGVDLNKPNLSKCKGTDAELVLGDIENLPFRDGVIEVVECIATMEHIARPEKAVKELRRIITEGRGVASISWTHYNWLRALSKSEVRMRLFWATRDLIWELLPTHVRKTLLNSPTMRKTFLKGYGIDRNRGFSWATILQILENASMHIVFAKHFKDEGIIVTCSVARKG